MLLAKMAFNGKNYQDAYNKYSKLIDEDINNIDAWIGKGLAAGFLSDGDKSTLDETKVCLNYADGQGIPGDQKSFIATTLLEISKNYIKELIKKSKNEIIDRGKAPTTTFELHVVKSVRNTADRFESNNAISDEVLNAVNFSLLASNYSSDLGIKKEQINIIDKFLSEINNELHEQKKKALLQIRQNVAAEISVEDTSYSAPEAPKSGGCYIATAIYQDYDHEKVKLLRRFRDEVLLKSRFGIVIVKRYYQYSPLLVVYSNERKALKGVIRWLIVEPLVWILKTKRS